MSDLSQTILVFKWGWIKYQWHSFPQTNPFFAMTLTVNWSFGWARPPSPHWAYIQTFEVICEGHRKVLKITISNESVSGMPFLHWSQDLTLRAVAVFSTLPILTLPKFRAVVCENVIKWTICLAKQIKRREQPLERKFTWLICHSVAIIHETFSRR